MPYKIPEVPGFDYNRLRNLIISCPVPREKWRPEAVVDYGLWWIDRRGRVIIEPHKGQREVLLSNARIRLVVSGAQSGKTSFGPWVVYGEILKRGPGTYLAITTTYDLFKNAMLPQMRLVFEKVLRIARFWRGDRVLEIADPQTGEFYGRSADDPSMWARILLRSVQSGGSLEAATAKFVWMDEFGMDEWNVDVWEAIRARVTATGGGILGTTTPYNLGWVYSVLYQRWKSGDPEITWFNWPSTANPMFPKEEFETARRTMEEWRFRMRYLGQFAEPPSLVYRLPEDFYVPRFTIPPHWPVVVGVDFGGANTARVALAQDPDTGKWFVFHEWLGGGIPTVEHAEKAWQDYGLWKGRLRAFGGAPGEGQERRDWAQAGFPVEEPPVAGVETRINAVQQLLREGRLHCFSDLHGLRHEFATYRRKTLSDGTILDEIADKNRFHRLDALGYAVVGIMYQGQTVDIVL